LKGPDEKKQADAQGHEKFLPVTRRGRRFAENVVCISFQFSSHFSSPTRINGAQKYGCDDETEASGAVAMDSDSSFAAGTSPSFPTPPIPLARSNHL